MTTVADTYAITTPFNPGIIYSVSPGIVVHHNTAAGTVGSGSFDSFALAATAGDTAEKTVKAGAIGVIYTIQSLLVSAFTGTTAPAAVCSLIFTNGAAGAEVGRITITPDLNVTHAYWLAFDPLVVLTVGNGLFCVLDGALGTGGGYTVCGAFWKE